MRSKLLEVSRVTKCIASVAKQCETAKWSKKLRLPKNDPEIVSLRNLEILRRQQTNPGVRAALSKRVFRALVGNG